MPAALSLSETSLISLLMESILFGFFTILFATSMYILFWKKRKTQGFNKSLIAVSIVMYSLAIMHLAVDMRRVIIGFIDHKDAPGGPEAYFNILSDPTYILKSSIYATQTLLGDAFVIYRLYVVWAYDKRIIAPAVIAFCGGITTGVGAVVSFSRVSPTAVVFISDLKHWITSFFSITLFTNFSCTVLIAFRIWYTGRRAKSFISSRSLSPVMVVIVESGAIYSATLISLLATYLSGSWGQYPVLDSVTPIIGCVFSLIIVRIGLGIASDETTRVTSAQGSAGSRGHVHKVQPFKPMAVQMTHTKYVRGDDGATLAGSMASETKIGIESKITKGDESFMAV